MNKIRSDTARKTFVDTLRVILGHLRALIEEC